MADTTDLKPVSEGSGSSTLPRGTTYFLSAGMVEVVRSRVSERRNRKVLGSPSLSRATGFSPTSSTNLYAAVVEWQTRQAQTLFPLARSAGSSPARSTNVPGWRNGIRARFRIWSSRRKVWVQVPLPVPLFYKNRKEVSLWHKSL